MQKVKKQHPADIAAEAVMISAIREASGFIASIFVGVGKYEKIEGRTVAEAICKGDNFVALNRINARPMIYAIAYDGRSTLLTSVLIEKLKAMKPA